MSYPFSTSLISHGRMQRAELSLNGVQITAVN